MRKKITTVLLLLMSFGLFATEKPNVILIIADDLNDYPATYGGHPQAITPHIDALAATGVKFTNAQTNCPICAPSRNSMLTGLYSFHSGDLGFTTYDKVPMIANSKTIMHLMLENGYKTYGQGKIIHYNNTPGVVESWTELGSTIGDQKGPFPFDGTDYQAHAEVPEPYRSIGHVDGSFGRLSTGAGSAGWVYAKGQPFRYVSEGDRDLLQGESTAKWAVDKIKEFEDSSNEEPFILIAGLVDTHTPLVAADKFFDLYPLEDVQIEPLVEDDTVDTYIWGNFPVDNQGPRFYQTLLKSYNDDRTLALKKFTQAYLACLSSLDAQVGTIVDALNASKFRDNTIIIFVSDHGWQNGDKNYLYKNSCWESSTRIPFIIKIPEQTTPKVIANPISLIDVYPTLVDYCGLDGDNKKNANGGKLGGYSLRPFIEGRPQDWQGPDGAVTMIGNYGKKTSSVALQNYTYRTEKWRYIIYSDGKEELYCHDETNPLNDPNELTNLAGRPEYNTLKTELRSKLSDVVGVTVGDDPLLLSKDFEDKSEGNNAKGNPVYVNHSTAIVKSEGSNKYAEVVPEAGQNMPRIGLGYNCEAGQRYTFMVDAKVPSGNTAIRVQKVLSGVIEQCGDHTLTEEWQTIIYSFTAEAGFNVLYLHMIDKASTIEVDNMRMYSGDYIPTAEPRDKAESNKAVIYPNPNIGVFNVVHQKNIVDYSIYNMNGSLVQRVSSLNTNNVRVDLEDYPVGVYVLHAKDETGNSMVNEFIIE